MNKLHLIALVLIVGSIALRNHISDGVLSIAIGIGLALVTVGLFQMFGHGRNHGPSSTLKE